MYLCVLRAFLSVGVTFYCSHECVEVVEEIERGERLGERRVVADSPNHSRV